MQEQSITNKSESRVFHICVRSAHRPTGQPLASPSVFLHFGVTFALTLRSLECSSSHVCRLLSHSSVRHHTILRSSSALENIAVAALAQSAATRLPQRKRRHRQRFAFNFLFADQYIQCSYLVAESILQFVYSERRRGTLLSTLAISVFLSDL